jgi:hypothetical protein
MLRDRDDLVEHQAEQIHLQAVKIHQLVLLFELGADEVKLLTIIAFRYWSQAMIITEPLREEWERRIQRLVALGLVHRISKDYAQMLLLTRAGADWLAERGYHDEQPA